MEFVIPGCKQQPPDRIACRKLHLTYAGLFPNELMPM